MIPAPIDNKNLMEDSFEDDIFSGFYEAFGHGYYGQRHLIGMKGDAYVDVKWHYASNEMLVQVIAVKRSEDFDSVSDEVLCEYERIFSEFECDENPGLVVELIKDRTLHRLGIIFNFKDE